MATYPAHPHHERPARVGSWLSLEGIGAKAADISTYWFALAGVYLMFGWSWYYAFHEKLVVGEGVMPTALKHVFQGSFIETVPGLNAAWTWLGVMEGLAVLGFAISLFSGEFLPSRRKPILLSALGWSILTYGALIFGEAMVGQTETVFELFGYITATIVVIMLVLNMPPYRERHWLSGLRDRSEA